MRKLYLFAAMAAMLASCSSDDLTKESAVAQQNADDGAVVFDAYQSRGTTRAGKTGTMTLNVLKQTDAGFGVFGYYTNNEGYSELAKPDFMYNQDVKYTTGWTYSPIKYWPNEFGSEAASERVDYLTFFAYAPYVQVESKTGKVESITSDETGIIALTRNTAIGDPLVKYVMDFDPTKCVDLCFGVAADNFTSSVASDAPKNNISAGKPYIDVVKPAADSKIKFDFKHALAQLNVQIDADIDDDTHTHPNGVNENTRIYVRSVSFEGFTDRGTLNLNSSNDRTVWYDITGTGNLSTKAVTVYDNRYDGREGVANVSAPGETPVGLNDKIVQDGSYNTEVSPIVTNQPGVTSTAVNLFKSATLGDPILVIPNGQRLAIKVVYDVETYDPNLATFLSDGKTKGSTIENAINKNVTINSSPLTLEPGKRYIVRLHLGLTSVKFDAEVDDWTSIDPEEGDYDLPKNQGSYVVAGVGAGSETSITIPAAGVTGATFTVAGLTADNPLSATFATLPTEWTCSPIGSTIGSDRIGKANYTITLNNKVTKKTNDLIVSDGSNFGTLHITQLPAALGLTAPSTPVKHGDKTINLSVTGGVDSWTGASFTVKRKRAGLTTTLEETTDYTTSGAVITLGTDKEAKAGDVYTITIQVGDADAETVSFTVEKAAGEISFTNTSMTYYISSGTHTITQAVNKTGDGDVTYSIVRTTGDSNPLLGTQVVSIDNDGKVTFDQEKAGDEFIVTATVVDSDNYTYADKTKTYTITIAQTAP